MEYIQTNSAASSSSFSTALDLLTKQQNVWKRRPKIPLANCPLDDAIGGGLAIGQLTEIVGPSGVGKTQLCLQLCINAQQAAGAEVVYVDTEGSFSTRRLLQMARHRLVDRLEEQSNSNAVPPQFEQGAKTMLDNVHYIRCHDHVQLVAAVFKLESLLRCRAKVGLVIIDSIALQFRGMAGRSDGDCPKSALVRLANELSRLAAAYSLSVVVTNQVTTRFTSQDEGYLASALGTGWAHCCANRIWLYRVAEDAERRCLHLIKSPQFSALIQCCEISASGVVCKDYPVKEAS